MKLEQSFEVAAPVDRVWRALIDIEHVAPLLPGATVTGRNPDGSYSGTFAVKIGPTAAAYSGTLTIDSINEQVRVASLHAHGHDRRGQGTAKATIFSTCSATPAGVTRVEVITEYFITGRLARFGRGGMIEDIAERLLREFAARLQASLGGAPVVDGGAVAANGGARVPAEVEETVTAGEAPVVEPEPVAERVPEPMPEPEPEPEPWGYAAEVASYEDQMGWEPAPPPEPVGAAAGLAAPVPQPTAESEPVAEPEPPVEPQAPAEPEGPPVALAPWQRIAAEAMEFTRRREEPEPVAEEPEPVAQEPDPVAEEPGPVAEEPEPSAVAWDVAADHEAIESIWAVADAVTPAAPIVPPPVAPTSSASEPVTAAAEEPAPAPEPPAAAPEPPPPAPAPPPTPEPPRSAAPAQQQGQGRPQQADPVEAMSVLGSALWGQMRRSPGAAGFVAGVMVTLFARRRGR